MPASRSRRALRAYATAATTIASARTIGSTHQRSSPYGRRRWSSPIGETHDNGEFRSPPASPTTRRRKLTPSTRMVIQRAARALWVSWAATAATAVKSQPATAYSRPSATEPAAPKPSPVRPTRDQGAEQGGRAERHRGRGGEAGLPADHCGPEQLATTLLLLGAGVPDHRQADGQRADQQDDAGSPRGDPTQVHGEDGPVERRERRVGHRVGERRERGLVGVEPFEAAADADDEEAEPDHPQGKEPAVPAQRQAYQLPGAGHRSSPPSPW